MGCINAVSGIAFLEVNMIAMNGRPKCIHPQDLPYFGKQISGPNAIRND